MQPVRQPMRSAANGGQADESKSRARRSRCAAEVSPARVAHPAHRLGAGRAIPGTRAGRSVRQRAAQSCARRWTRRVVSSTNASCAMACRRISSSRRPAAHRGSIASRSTRTTSKRFASSASLLEPASVRLSGPRIVYEFASAAPGASISFHIRPQRLWRHTSAVSIDGGARVEISQLTYP